MRRVRKVVIPVAGMGTRFLPVTKVLPKELLPIVSVPIIHFIAQEAVQAGLETIIFVTSRPKVLIEDYFDPFDLTTYRLKGSNKASLLDDTVALAEKIDIVSVRQYQPLGLGDAILKSRPIVGDEPFAVILGDDLIMSDGDSAIAQCLKVFQGLDSGSVVGCVEVEAGETQKYGIVKTKGELSAGPSRVEAFVEKPKPGTEPSRWAIPGRYVFEKEIFQTLQKTPMAANGELQLTDAMDRLNKERAFYACSLSGERHDTGDQLGYIKANVALALKDSELKESLRAWLHEIIGNP
jgi:UTP--glucose-1-phosphate uridylyltransferase